MGFCVELVCFAGFLGYRGGGVRGCRRLFIFRVGFEKVLRFFFVYIW